MLVFLICHNSERSCFSFQATRGRNAGYPAPPAQTPASGFPAPGSSVVLAFARAITLCKHLMLPLLLRDPGRRHTCSLQRLRKGLPCEATPLTASAIKPFECTLDGPVIKAVERVGIPDKAVINVVT